MIEVPISCLLHMYRLLQTYWQMTRNQELNVLHVDDAASFVKSVDQRTVTGDTLIFDFVYFLHPV